MTIANYVSECFHLCCIGRPSALAKLHTTAQRCARYLSGGMQLRDCHCVVVVAASKEWSEGLIRTRYRYVLRNGEKSEAIVSKWSCRNVYRAILACDA